MTGKIPSKRPQRAIEWVDSLIAPFERQLEKCSLRGLMVRGYYADWVGTLGKNDRGDYDDAFFWRDKTSGLFVSYNANADASIYRKAVANIKSNQVCWYKKGLHGVSGPNPYLAFRQSRPITVIRDNVGPDSGMFFTNLHRGGVVGTSSLGCLTIPPSQWDSCRETGFDFLRRNDQAEVPVVVIEHQG